jgi:arginyl-tRNA synthetase
VLAASAQLAGAGLARGKEIALERPPRPELGDYSTNAALLLAPGLAQPPRDVAQRLGVALQQRLGSGLARFDVAGPGFLNLFLAPSWFAAALAGVLHAGERFGAGGAASRERILVEFVSANPTGPLHVGHARNAAYGDALARVLALHGHEVQREFYVNDAGSQILKFGQSIQALARGEQVPADGYRGEYVHELAAALPAAADEQPGAVGRAAVQLIMEQLSQSLQAFGVVFDSWSHESSLHIGDPSPVARAIELLTQQGHTYHSEGALWLRTTAYGDDKDRVLVRSGGEHTYFASDIAYHQDKRARGFQRQIDVWGADHHGYVARMKAAYEALGGDPEHLEMLIMQLVHLLRRGERAQMSKRAGELVTLDDLLSEIGVDAARWFLLSRSHDTTIDLDLDLAREQSAENPVYYVQYAHARIASVLAKAGRARVAQALDGVGTGGKLGELDAERERGELGAELGMGELGAELGMGELGAELGMGELGAELGLGELGVEQGRGELGVEQQQARLEHPSEQLLIKQLLAFPAEIQEAARRRAPHRIATYVLELAQAFTAFYRDCHVLDVQPHALESLRLRLCVATQRVIACALDLLGVSAPTEM